MIPQIIDVIYISDYKVWLRFDDGKEGEIDLKDELWGEVFEPLKDLSIFEKVRLDRELGTICWENGADFAPEFLYDNLKTDCVTQVWAQLNIDKMSVDERLELIGKIWDSIEELPPLTKAQKAELDRRIESYRASPGDGVTWEAVKARLITTKDA